jgi:hypothetical protein
VSRFVVVGGVEGPVFEAIIFTDSAGISFDSADQLHYLGVRGSEVFLVEVEAEG